MIHEENHEMSLLSKAAHIIPYFILYTYLLYFNDNLDVYFRNRVGEVGPTPQSQR